MEKADPLVEGFILDVGMEVEIKGRRDGRRTPPPLIKINGGTKATLENH